MYYNETLQVYGRLRVSRSVGQSVGHPGATVPLVTVRSHRKRLVGDFGRSLAESGDTLSTMPAVSVNARIDHVAMREQG